MTLQGKLRIIGRTLATVVPASYHYWRSTRQRPFLVWQEEGEDGALHADDRKVSQVVSGSIDYFTKTEYDPIVEDIQTALQELQGKISFGWRLDSVQYEEETNYIHWQWRFSV